jgi:hypothetical protein
MDSQSEAALFRSYAFLLYKDIQQYMKEHQDEYVAYLENQEKEESTHVKKSKAKKG